MTRLVLQLKKEGMMMKFKKTPDVLTLYWEAKVRFSSGSTYFLMLESKYFLTKRLLSFVLTLIKKGQNFIHFTSRKTKFLHFKK